MKSPGHETNLDQVIRAAKARFTLPHKSIHGVAHWQRVRENGLRLAKTTGADVALVELFAFLHDCCREDDGSDPDHGPRAAEFAEMLRGDLIHLQDDDFDLLHEAVRDHTYGDKHPNATIGTCWDADRLDIGRVGFKPQPRYMSTQAAKNLALINWAYKRSRIQ